VLSIHFPPTFGWAVSLLRDDTSFFHNNSLALSRGPSRMVGEREDIIIFLIRVYSLVVVTYPKPHYGLTSGTKETCDWFKKPRNPR